MRKRVPHFEMCKIFKSEHEAKFGGFYFITNLDAKEAHEFFVLNGEVETDQLRSYCRNYFADDFAGWVERMHPAWLFFKHFNSFAPKIERKAIHRTTRCCPDCGTTHSINTPCPPLRDTGGLIAQIGRKAE